MRYTQREIGAQEGFAALIIAIVLVSVLSLITVGFAQLMRSEQRSAVDRQLSSQAYFAAESGINNAQKAIKAGYSIAKTECGTAGSGGATDGSVDITMSGSKYLTDNTVGQAGGATTEATIPCLLINPKPEDLKYDPVDVFTPTVAEFTARNAAGDPTQVSKIKISWQDAAGGNSFLPSPGDCGDGQFVPAGSLPGQWNYTGILRFELIPLFDLSRNGLTSNSLTTYLCPRVGASSPTTYGPSTTGVQSGIITLASCSTSNTPRYCNAEINGLDALTDQTTFFISLKSIYSKTAVTITAEDSSGTKLFLTGAQIVIDSTGKAQDVLRRLQVRIPAQNTYDVSSSALGGGMICKQVEAEPANFDNKCD